MKKHEIFFLILVLSLALYGAYSAWAQKVPVNGEQLVADVCNQRCSAIHAESFFITNQGQCACQVMIRHH